MNVGHDAIRRNIVWRIPVDFMKKVAEHSSTHFLFPQLYIFLVGPTGVEYISFAVTGEEVGGMSPLR